MVAAKYVLADLHTAATTVPGLRDLTPAPFLKALLIALGPNQYIMSQDPLAPLAQMPLPTAFQATNTVASHRFKPVVFLQGDKTPYPTGAFVPGKDTAFPRPEDVRDYLNKRTDVQGDQTRYNVPSDQFKFFNL